LEHKLNERKIIFGPFLHHLENFAFEEAQQKSFRRFWSHISTASMATAPRKRELGMRR
jgi:hypothetical protein